MRLAGGSKSKGEARKTALSHKCVAACAVLWCLCVCVSARVCVCVCVRLLRFWSVCPVRAKGCSYTPLCQWPGCSRSPFCAHCLPGCAVRAFGISCAFLGPARWNHQVPTQMWTSFVRGWLWQFLHTPLQSFAISPSLPLGT